MGGKAQVPDTSRRLLRHQIAVDAVAFIQIGVDVHFAHIVEQVKIEVAGLAFFQLFLKDSLHLVHIGKVIAGELGGEIVAVPGICVQDAAHHQLRLSAVIAPGGVVVVDPVFHGKGHHFGRGPLVDAGIIPLYHRQAHGPHAQSGKLQSLKILLVHRTHSFL